MEEECFHMNMKDFGFYMGVNLGGWFSQCDYSEDRMEHFITEIHIDKLRHLENIEIKLSNETRQHLLLTGKNGSGKTSTNFRANS